MDWHNHFLDALDPADIGRLAADLVEVTLERGAVLDEPGRTVRDVYLPIDCVLSLVTVMRDGGQVESRTIGCESGYGLLHALGSSTAYERMSVQVAGRAWKLPLERLRAAALESDALSRCIVHHAQVTLLQSAQSSACNSLHTAEQRLARWLLQTRERLRTDVLPLTQEHLAVMLGVQRTTVTAVASELQAKGLISYVRGRITIEDRSGLERVSCECFQTVQRGIDTLLKPKRRATV
ncbi:Crp/Fnr family transcriptional regulator [Phenylobacterium sp. J367]|uniref:Crp/Fnr family transcriptional regulator n=1 Tax=Phenylobacterium sp. J367 TaxID=2898435 RepID=UPI002151632B|nr:Crp/Fnr family transcriptional regulator [Phenylobacterium sp. J367]MCR5878945.1 Crp/Fnr family transcriptional regulator [Phenylobacterium sp. J367]